MDFLQNTLYCRYYYPDELTGGEIPFTFQVDFLAYDEDHARLLATPVRGASGGQTARRETRLPARCRAR